MLRGCAFFFHVFLKEHGDVGSGLGLFVPKGFTVVDFKLFFAGSFFDLLFDEHSLQLIESDFELLYLSFFVLKLSDRIHLGLEITKDRSSTVVDSASVRCHKIDEPNVITLENVYSCFVIEDILSSVQGADPICDDGREGGAHESSAERSGGVNLGEYKGRIITAPGRSKNVSESDPFVRTVSVNVLSETGRRDLTCFAGFGAL